MSRFEILARVRLGPHHRWTGRIVLRRGDEHIEKPFELRISQFDGEQGVYLLYTDPDGADLQDSWHANVGSARQEARDALGVEPGEWEEMGA